MESENAIRLPGRKSLFLLCFFQVFCYNEVTKSTISVSLLKNIQKEIPP